MSSKYDLHTHSTASDGTLAPRELITQGAKAGIEIISLTDHDTLSGIDEASKEALKIGLKLIPGVEISVSWSGITIHILGLGVDHKNKRLIERLDQIKEIRLNRARLISQKLSDFGCPDLFKEAMQFSNGQAIGRTHFARALIKAGYAKNIGHVFKNFLVKGKPGYVKDAWIALPEAIKMIKSAGGQAVIAHPKKYKLSRTKLKDLTRDFADLGGEGLEIISGCYDFSEEKDLVSLANDHNLLGSLGSDYHGPDKPWVKLGNLPGLSPLCKPIWHDWVERHQV